MNTKRPRQEVFISKDCGYQVNADYNGAKNIKKRGFVYMVSSGVFVTQPEGEKVFCLHSPTSKVSVGSS
ncbi:MAG: hypothetical protein ACFE68_08130 [Candidatus Hodarchaeota archaeon]